MPFYIFSGSVEQGLAYGLMALGVYVTFRVLNFPDLTVDGSFPLGGAVASVMIVGGTPPVIATIMAVLGGLLAGAVTGFLNTKMRISGLLAGILTMTALYSINLRVMGRSNIPLLRTPTVFRELIDAGVSKTYVELLLFFIVAIILKLAVDWFLKTEFGLALRATGDNQQMIRSLGVDTDLMKIVGLALSNGFVALSGALVAQYQGFSDVGMGIGMIIAGLASVIIGEVIVKPNTIFRATLGVVLGSIIYRLAIFFALRGGFAPTDLKIVTALLVIGALSAPTLQTRMRAQATRRRRRQGAKSLIADGPFLREREGDVNVTD